MGEYVTIDPERQVQLKKIIGRLHEGTPVSEVKKEFAKLIHGVSAAEVAAMEQSLIDGGMPVEEVQRLCEVHVQVFENSLAKADKPSGIAGHPVHSMLEENKLAKKKASALKAAARSWAWGIGSRDTAQKALDDLSAIIIHYARKENQLFPYLEKQGFTGPSRVMWGKHDEIRALFKDARQALDRMPGEFSAQARALASKIKKMIFMEENILIPEATRRLSIRDWAEIRQGEEAIGFAEMEARKVDVKIRVDIPENLPPVHADRIMIEQVLLNLVKNGIEAMVQTPRQDRQLTVAARLADESQVEIEVRDRGHGIDFSDAEKLFAPFFTTKQEGMGMGLNICRTIIEFHNGHLDVVPGPEGGTAFRFTLPIGKTTT